MGLLSLCCNDDCTLRRQCFRYRSSRSPRRRELQPGDVWIRPEPEPEGCRAFWSIEDVRRATEAPYIFANLAHSRPVGE